MKTKIKITDKSRVPELLKELKALKDRKLEIGILAESGEKMLMIANVNEFGCEIVVTDKMRKFFAAAYGVHLKKTTEKIVIPERSFMRGGFDYNQKNIENTAEKLLEKLVDGTIDTETYLEFLGEYTAGKIKEYLINLRTPANSPLTIRQKRSSNPLVDTGHLKDTITYKVL